MTRAVPVLAVCAACAALVAAGCGSSKSSGAASATKTSTPHGGGQASATTSTGATAKGGLVPDGKINYAKPAPGAPTQSGVVEIGYREFTIEPDTLKAKVGSTLKWTNYDPSPCNVTSEGGPYKFASKNFGEGGTFELKLTKPGTIHYECTSYPTTMNGTIEVVE